MERRRGRRDFFAYGVAPATALLLKGVVEKDAEIASDCLKLS
jgi:hypothetical protein